MIFAVVFSFIWGCSQKPEDSVSGIVNKLKSSNSIHFKAVEKAYYSNEPDTTVTPYEVWAVRDAQDTVKGGYVWVDNNYRPYNMMYERGDFYLAIPPKNTSILYPDFNESFINETDWIDYFLKPDVLEGILKDKNNKVFLRIHYSTGRKVCLSMLIFP